MRTYHLPWRLPALAVFVAVLGALFLLLGAGHLGAGFRALEVYPLMPPILLAACLVGAGMEVPLGDWKVEPSQHPGPPDAPFRWAGIPYRGRLVEPDRVVLTVNLGGTVVPLLVSWVFLRRTGLTWEIGAAALVTAAASWGAARCVPRLGVAVFPLLPAVFAAGAAVVLTPGPEASATAWIAGSVGPLLGADLGRLPAALRMGGTVVCVGGAGTFEAVFMAGATAVLLG